MTLLPKHLHTAYDWIDSAGELETLATLTGAKLRQYCIDSAKNCDDGSVTTGDLLDVHDWLVKSGFTAAVRKHERLLEKGRTAK